MTIHTWGVGLNVTPTVIGRSVDHYVNRKKRKQKPTAHLSYDVALGLIRQFLTYASKHTVEDVQAFTAQWVPTPTWVHTDQIKISAGAIDKAAGALIKQLGPQGIKQIGGKTWWKWRRDGADLKAEWIEMKADRKARQKRGEQSKRVMLYVHGGAYFFGSVDEHRYQMQRHARKLKARVLAPRYRLAPQFPFPCGLLDCLATYLHLLGSQDPSTIILAGDSAGGGMIVSLLVTLRDQGLPMPAGAILISPWVDLTHSFPSVSEGSDFDYIPPHGFMQKPSMAWPPPNSDDLKTLKAAKPAPSSKTEKTEKKDQSKEKESDADAAQGVVVKDEPGADPRTSTTSIPADDLSLMIDGKNVQLRDQIQMYATNEQLSHPLVSPVLQPSLGGLPPLLILVGGGEMLRDEQIYLGHKAANPAKYPPSEAYLEKYGASKDEISKYKPTLVQLQVWDDLCHVAPTLSFTRPAKYMYRSIAQFGAWALAQAQKTDIDIVDDDEVSIISTDTSSDEDEERQNRKEKHKAEEANKPTDKIGKAGDDIPHFRNHMVRQRVDRHGNVYRLAAESHLPALQVSPDLVGVVKPGPVRKWMVAKSQWDSKYSRQKRKVQKRRLKEMQKGFLEFKEDGVVEAPPPSALAGRRGLTDTAAPKAKKSMGLMFWSMVGSKHDEDAIDREEKLDRDAEAKVTITQADGTTTVETTGGAKDEPTTVKSPSGSRHRTVSYQGNVNENTTAAELEARKQKEEMAAGAIATAAVGTATASVLATSSKDTTTADTNRDTLSPTFVPLSKLKQSPDADIPDVSSVDAEKDTLVLEGTNVTLASPDATRPKADGVAFPFKLNKALGDHVRNPSMITLTSTIGGVPDTPGARPETPGSPKNDDGRSLAPSALSREVSSAGAVASTTDETDLDATPKPKKMSAPVDAGLVAGGITATIAAAATTVASAVGVGAVGTTGRTTTSETIETISTVESTEIVTTPPVVATSTIFSSGPTLFPTDEPSTSEKAAAGEEPAAEEPTSEKSASETPTGETPTGEQPARSAAPDAEKQLQLNGSTEGPEGPIRTQTPDLGQHLASLSALGLESRGKTGGDATPKGGTESDGWATPRANSISTAAPSEAGDTLSRFETAEE